MKSLYGDFNSELKEIYAFIHGCETQQWLKSAWTPTTTTFEFQVVEGQGTNLLFWPFQAEKNSVETFGKQLN